MDSDDSIVQTRRCKRRIIYSSDEEVTGREDEVPFTTPSEAAISGLLPLQPTSHGSQAGASIERSVGTDEVLITFSAVYDSPWDSDDAHSDTSTPGYKRGHHELEDVENISPPSRAGGATPQGANGLKEKLLPYVPQWMKCKPTTIILSDNYLQEWPVQTDSCCVIQYKPGYDMWKWNSVIRSQHLNIQYYNVVLCLSKLKEVDGIIPIKNNILALVRSIRSVNMGCRVFICNLPPNPHGSPVLGKRISTVNQRIHSAVYSVGRTPSISKVHYLSIYEHLVSSEGKIITPVVKYLFTRLGCALFREFVLREIGAKTYWFNGNQLESDTGSTTKG